MLGRSDEATAAAARVCEIVEGLTAIRPRDVSYQRLFAQGLLVRGQIQMSSAAPADARLADMVRGVAILRRVAALHPDRVEWRADFLRGLLITAETEARLGRFPAAAEHAAEAVSEMGTVKASEFPPV